MRDDFETLDLVAMDYLLQPNKPISDIDKRKIEEYIKYRLEVNNIRFGDEYRSLAFLASKIKNPELLNRVIASWREYTEKNGYRESLSEIGSKLEELGFKEKAIEVYIEAGNFSRAKNLAKTLGLEKTLEEIESSERNLNLLNKKFIELIRRGLYQDARLLLMYMTSAVRRYDKFTKYGDLYKIYENTKLLSDSILTKFIELMDKEEYSDAINLIRAFAIDILSTAYRLDLEGLKDEANDLRDEAAYYRYFSEKKISEIGKRLEEAGKIVEAIKLYKLSIDDNKLKYALKLAEKIKDKKMKRRMMEYLILRIAGNNYDLEFFQYYDPDSSINNKDIIDKIKKNRTLYAIELAKKYKLKDLVKILESALKDGRYIFF